MSRLSRVTKPLVLASTGALAASLLAVGAAPAATAAPAAIEVRTDLAGFAKEVFGVANNLFKCEDIATQGSQCVLGPTVRNVMDRLSQIEATIARNQQQTMRALDSLQRGQDAQDLNRTIEYLRPIRANIGEAASAWNALSECAEKATAQGASCKGYAGVLTDEMPVAEAMTITREFFVDQMDKISLSVEEATIGFSGSSEISGRDGFAYALWKSAKRDQDRASGVTDAASLSLRPHVVTHKLSSTFLPPLLYYQELLFLFGALHPAALELKALAEQKPSNKARSEATLADKYIYATTDRWTVAGTYEFYKIPNVGLGSIAYVSPQGDRVFKIVPDGTKGETAKPHHVQDLGQKIAATPGYRASVMAANPSLLPQRGLYGVEEKVKHRTYPEYQKKYAVCASTSPILPCDSGRDGVATDTFELGWDGPVGSKDKDGNQIIVRRFEMQVLDQAASWSGLVKTYKDSFGCSLKGEPPYGVHNVQFLTNFRRYSAGKYANFVWMSLSYGSRVTECVGPGVYTRTSPAKPMVIDLGAPAGVLQASAACPTINPPAPPRVSRTPVSVSLRCPGVTVAAGSIVKLRGKITPADAKVRVRYQMRWDGVAWRDGAAMRPSSTGQYQFNVRIAPKAPEGRTYLWRIVATSGGKEVARSRVLASTVS